MNKLEIPDIIVSRLPVYLRALSRMQAQQRQTTSSQELGELVGIERDVEGRDQLDGHERVVACRGELDWD